MTPEQKAKAELFGDPNWEVRNPDSEFLDANFNLITYNALVEKYRAEGTVAADAAE